ncbi:hypothetical protein APV28_0210 [Comamonas testosteroni]|nr:hypothetical protein APV28_0210 [Comamonas testosteroni]
MQVPVIGAGNRDGLLSHGRYCPIFPGDSPAARRVRMRTMAGAGRAQASSDRHFSGVWRRNPQK